MLLAFYPEKVKKPKVPRKKTKKMIPTAPEASDSEGEDDDVDIGLAANAEVPMELDGKPLTAAELTSVDVAEKEFAKKVHTLAAEADATFKVEFGIKCTSQIMDIVSCSHIYFWLYSYLF